VVGAIVLVDDLLQRGDVLAGRLEQPQPALLSLEQLQDEAPLPPYLLVEPDQLHSPSQVAEAVWIAFFRHLLDVAHRRGCPFLKKLVSFELALRNALTAERARVLDLPAEPIAVAADLIDEPVDVERIVNEWAAARTPLVGLQVLDHARWDWLAENDRWFSFAIDELAAYAAKLTLLCRWERIADAIEAQSHAAASSS